MCHSPWTSGPIQVFGPAGSGDQKEHVGCGVRCYGNCGQVGREQNWLRRLMIPHPFSTTPPNQYPLSTKLTNQRMHFCVKYVSTVTKEFFQTLYQLQVIRVHGLLFILLKPSFLLPNIPLLPHLVDFGQLYFS